jgi:hypothetical protein
MSQTSYHVIPAPGGGWSVRRRGAKRSVKHFEAKARAIAYGREISRKWETDLVIHKRDGTIEKKVIRNKRVHATK